MKNAIIALGLLICMLLVSCGEIEIARHLVPTPPPAPAPLPRPAPLPIAPPAPKLGPADDLNAQLAIWQQAETDAYTAQSSAHEAEAAAKARVQDATANVRLLAAAKADQARAAEVEWILWATLIVVALAILGAGVCVGLAAWVPAMAGLARGGGYLFGGIAAAALLLRVVLLYLPWVLGGLAVVLAVAVLWRVRKAFLAHEVDLAEAEAKRLAANVSLASLHQVVSQVDVSKLGEEAAAAVGKARDEAANVLRKAA
jgi:hypothetical protein